MPIATQQTSSVDLSADKYERIPASTSEVGGTLISIVTKGLYTNPLDCVREYVQNGVDSGASEVTIQITGNSVTIHDNGTGMSRDELVRARGLAISDKDPNENVGFRGIGIYSGYEPRGQDDCDHETSCELISET